MENRFLTGGDKSKFPQIIFHISFVIVSPIREVWCSFVDRFFLIEKPDPRTTTKMENELWKIDF